MINQSKALRLNRIFRSDGRTLIVAMDAPSSSWIAKPPGLEHPDKVFDLISQGGADAILAQTGTITRYAVPYARRLGLIATVPLNPMVVSGAAALGCDGVKTTHFMLPDEIKSPETMEALLEFALECNKYAMPFLCEIVPFDREKFKLVLEPDAIAVACRTAADAGADFIKTMYPGTPEGWKKITTVCPVPVVMLGGQKTDNVKDLLTNVKDSIDAGGAGIAMGRNIWRHKNPTSMVKALVGIIHEGKSVDEVLSLAI